MGLRLDEAFHTCFHPTLEPLGVLPWTLKVVPVGLGVLF